MTTIHSDLLASNALRDHPTDKPLPAVAGRLTALGPHLKKQRENGEPYTMQSFTLRLEGGERVSGYCFDHLDLAPYLAKDVVLASFKSRNGRYGGVTVKRSKALFGGEKLELTVSKLGVLHTPETWEAVKGKMAEKKPKRISAKATTAKAD